MTVAATPRAIAPSMIVLTLPSPIARITGPDGKPVTTRTANPNERKLALPAGRAVSLKITLKSA